MKLILLIFLLGLLGCARGPLKEKSDALRPFSRSIQFVDDMDLQGFAESLLANIQHLKAKPKHILQFNEVSIPAREYVKSLEALHKVVMEQPDQLQKYLQDYFNIYEVYGNEKWGEAFITSYYEPVIEGSLKKTDKLSQALYAVPEDMAIVRLDEFSNILGDSFVQRFCKELETCKKEGRYGILRARIDTKKEGLSEIVPYYERSEIDGGENKLKAKILAWVDPVDAFVLQIQGSGTISIDGKKELKLGYAGQNGRSYEAVGKYLFDVIPKEKMSLQRIEAHLHSLPPGERQELLNKNPSYVFFQEIKTKPVTYFGIETIEGRTIATDKRYFPKGALAFLKFKKPLFSSQTELDPSDWQSASRFVFDHDTGGAIKGGGRLDLFWGKGEVAKRSAGVMRQTGKLYYLAPKTQRK